MADDEDPLSDDYLDRYYPESPAIKGDVWVGDEKGFNKDKRNARKDFHNLEESNVLDETVNSEGPFLAKMYVVAEHFGELEEFKALLKRGMQVRPDKVKAASLVFKSLSQIYKDVAEIGEKYWNAVRDGHFVGDAADAYHDEFDTLLKYMHRGKRGLSDVALNTHKLTGEFGNALHRWQKELADAIREMAEYERNRVAATVESFAVGLVTDNPIEAAKETLDTLLHLFEQSEETAKRRREVLDKIDLPDGFGLDDPLNDNVGYQQLNLPDPWDGKIP